MKFFPCNADCLVIDEQCQGCGRSEADITEMNKSVDALVAFAEKKGFENLDDFVTGVTDSLSYKLGLGH